MLLSRQSKLFMSHAEKFPAELRSISFPSLQKEEKQN